MTANEIVQDEFQILELDGTCDQAMNYMDDCKLNHYPVLEGGIYKGLISEDDIFQVEDWSLTIQESSLRPIMVSVEEEEHFLVVVQKLQLSKLTCLPVVDSRGLYKGLITRSRIVDVFGSASLVQDLGSVIEIELAPRDYYLAEIARIVENTGVKILGTYIRTVDENKIILTLKLNKQDAEEALSALDRYNYKISASYFLKSDNSTNQDRFDNLMHILNL